jgi:hypothetical protein
MAEILHSVSELRNRFEYDPVGGTLRWRPAGYALWSKGKPRPSLVRYETWRRKYAGRPVEVKLRNGVPCVLYRERVYMLGRLLWALSKGVHPTDRQFVVFRNGKHTDIRFDNLQLVGRDGLRRLRAQRQRGEAPTSRAHIPDAEVLERWLRYREGELYWQAVSLVEFAGRYKAATWVEHEEWLHQHADQQLENINSRRPPQKVLYGTRRLSKADLVFAVVRGFVLPDGVELVHVDGNWRNCRYENLRIHYPEGFGADDEDEDD